MSHVAMTETVVVFDLDGTLTNHAARLHLALAKRWTEYHSAGASDPSRPAIVQLAKALTAAGCAILIATGRPEQYREMTNQWLAQHEVPYQWLLMRPDGEVRPGAVVKRELYQRWQVTTHQAAWMAVEDDTRNVAMWGAIGVACLYCGNLPGG